MCFYLYFGYSTYCQITRDSAITIVKNRVLGGNWADKEIFASATPIDTLLNVNSNNISRLCKYWNIFVDEQPYANWGHPCKDIFIDVTTGVVHLFNKKMPPSKIINMDIIHRVCPLTTTKSSQLFKIPKPNHPRNVTTSNNEYAVIISGGCNKFSNRERYWNDCSAMYQALVNVYNYDKDKIFVLMADGTNPGADLHLNNGSYISSPLDLDGDGIDDIQYSATYSNISLVFDSLARVITDTDNVFVFVTDHGGEGSTICLWNDQNITTSQFATEINKVSVAKTINICMEQCFSGGYTTALAGCNRVISTACSYNEFSHSTSDYVYDEFCYHWISAVLGATPNGTPVNADYNSDGYVSMEEAFYYANTHDSRQETPQYYSNKTCLGASMDLGGVFDHSCFGIDLYTRDNATDDGTEPLNDPLNGLTDSPDIWLRNFQDGGTLHQQMANGTNYLYARVRNRGTDTSWSGDLIRIFARPTFLNWHRWNESSWSEFCVAPLPRIAPGRDTIICIPVNNQDLGTINANYALYSRVESPFDPLFATETTSVGRNVEDNNNISLKNVYVTNAMIMPDNYGLDAVFAVSSQQDDPVSDIRIRLSDNGLNILDAAEVTLIFPEDFMTTWTPSFSGMKQLNSNTFIAKGEEIELYNIGEAVSEDGVPVTVRYNFLTRRDRPEGIYKTQVLQHAGDGEDMQILGGLTIQVERPGRDADNLFTAHAGNDTAVLMNTSATLHATAINETAIYRWYDKQRNFKYEGLNYTVSPSEASEYILEVTAKSDGYRDLDTVKVNVVPSCIRSITPNPVTESHVTVSYEYAPTVTSAYLNIYNAATATLAGSYNLSSLDNAGSLDIDVSSFPSGSYTVVLVCDNVPCHNKILIKH